MTGFDPLAAALAKEVSGDLARSALPDAPVVPDRVARARRVPRARLRLAAALHRLAAVVEPARRAPQCRPAH